MSKPDDRPDAAVPRPTDEERPTRDEEPIDAEFTPADEGADDDPSAGGGVGWPAAALMSAGAALVGGFFGVIFDGPASDPALADRVAALESRPASAGEAGRSGPDAAAVAALERQISSARAEMAALQTEVAILSGVDPGDRDAALSAARADELAALRSEIAEERRAALDSAMAAFEAEDGVNLAALPDEVAALRAAVGDAQAAADAASARAEEIDGIAADVDALVAWRDGVAATLADVEAATEALAVRVTGARGLPARDMGAAAALAFAALEDAIAEGRAFAVEHDAADAYFAGAAEFAALGAHAETGAPSRADLAERFDAVAQAAVVAERGEVGGLIDQFAQVVTGLVTVNRTDAPETEAAADIVVRARAAVRAGDLTAAVGEMRRLKDVAADAAAEWIGDAEARIAVDQNLAALRADLTAG